MGNDTLNKYEDDFKVKNIFSTLYTFTMALVLIYLDQKRTSLG